MFSPIVHIVHKDFGLYFMLLLICLLPGGPPALCMGDTFPAVAHQLSRPKHVGLHTAVTLQCTESASTQATIRQQPCKPDSNLTNKLTKLLQLHPVFLHIDLLWGGPRHLHESFEALQLICLQVTLA